MFTQAKTECRQLEDNIFYESPYFDSAYSYLYLKLEEALINDQKTLNSLRAGFISMGESTVVTFDDIQLEVVNGINDTCHSDWYNQSHGKIFCANSTDPSMWELCVGGLHMTFSAQSFDVVQAKNDNFKISRNTIWLSLVHGSITSLFSLVSILNSEFEFNWPSDFHLTLRINELKCNPSLLLTKCVLSELFSWVSIVIGKTLIISLIIIIQIKVYSYSEAGSRPLTWDQNQKGIITFNDYDFIYDYSDYDDSKVMEFMKWSMNAHSFVKLSLVEYVFVSLCLAVVIAKFFPAIYSQIVSKAVNSLEYQSLYWGSTVVTNVFTYGLVFVGARGWSLFRDTMLALLSNLFYIQT